MIVKVLNYEYTPELQNKSSQAYKDMERNFTAVVKYRLDLINVQFPSTSLFGDDNSEFTQQDGRKKKTAERSCVTNVTRLFLTCFVVIFT